MDLNIKRWVVQKDREVVVFLKSEKCINSPHQFWGKPSPICVAHVYCLYCVAPFAVERPDKYNLTEKKSWGPRWLGSEGTIVFLPLKQFPD